MTIKSYFNLSEKEREIALCRNFVPLYLSFKKRDYENHFLPNLFIENFVWELQKDNTWKLLHLHGTVDIGSFYFNWFRFEKNADVAKELNQEWVSEEFNKENWFLKAYVDLIPLEDEDCFGLNRVSSIVSFNSYGELTFGTKYQHRLNYYKEFCRKNNLQGELKKIQLSELFGTNDETHRFVEEGTVEILKQKDDSFFTDYLKSKIVLFRSELNDAWNNSSLLSDLHNFLLSENKIEFNENLFIYDYNDDFE